MSDALIALEAYWRGMSPLTSAVLTLLGGVCLAYLGRFLATKVLKLLRFETFSTLLGITEFLRKGGVRYTAVELVGVLAYWVILAATFIGISRILDFTVVQELSEQIRVIVPSAIAAIFIVIVGVVIVTFLANFTMTLARNAAIPNAQLLAKAIKCIGIGIVIVIAFDLIGFGKTILNPMILMLFGAVVFSVGLAFGLGCKDIARNAVERFLRELREREQGAKGTDMEG